MRILLFFCLLFSIQVSAQKSGPDETGTADELAVYIPNAFTPNGDGINEVWKVVMSGLELDSYEVVVVDRGGKEVFYSTDPLEVWTGSTRNGEYISSPSLFIYLVKLKAKGSTELKTYRGHITMVR